MAGVTIRYAKEEDVDQMFRLTKELAEYINEPNTVYVTPTLLKENLQFYKCLVVEDGATDDAVVKPLVGFAQYLYKFSCWDGWVCMLESLYIVPEFRHKGIGATLYHMVTKDAATKGCAFMEIIVHDWNKDAKRFYTTKGASDYTSEKGGHLFRTPISKFLEK